MNLAAKVFWRHCALKYKHLPIAEPAEELLLAVGFRVDRRRGHVPPFYHPRPPDVAPRLTLM
jgi:hypothetical protein